MVDSGGYRHISFTSRWIKDLHYNTYTDLVRCFYNYSVSV